MKILSVLILSVVIQSCDSPQRTRSPFGSEVGEFGTNSGSEDAFTSIDTDNSGGNVPPQTENDTNRDLLGEGYDSCNLNYTQSTTNAIGYFALCQNSMIPTGFKLKMAQSDTNSGTCFVPIHIQSNNTAFNIGIAQCVRNNAEQVYDMNLATTRNELLNGVMIVKASSIDYYMACMSAKVKYINQYCPNNPNNQQCTLLAEQYASTVCNEFAGNHQGQYKQVRL